MSKFTRDMVLAALKKKEEARKAAVPAKVRKGLCEVGQLAEKIQCLYWLLQNVTFEAEAEGDDSQIPARLEDSLRDLSKILVDMADEETKELWEQQNPGKPMFGPAMINGS